MKLIIDIPEEDYEWINTHLYTTDYQTTQMLYKRVRNGIPFDSVIKDIKAEIFRQSKQTNESFSHDWNEGFNDGMFHVLTIIKEYFKHISGKENNET